MGIGNFILNSQGGHFCQRITKFLKYVFCVMPYFMKVWKIFSFQRVNWNWCGALRELIFIRAKMKYPFCHIYNMFMLKKAPITLEAVPHRHIKAAAYLFCLNSFIFSIPERFLKILLTYFSAEICTLILSNWRLPNLCGLLAEDSAVIRKLWHRVASLMGTSKVYNCPFVHTT